MRIVLSGLIVLAAACSLAQSSYTAVDNFNDGLRNKALWKKLSYKPTTQLIESNRRLRFVTGDVNPLESTFAMWRLKTTRVMVNSDTIETTVMVNIPSLFNYDTDSILRMGIRWSDPTDSRNNITLALQRKATGVNFHVTHGGAGGGGGATEFAIPDGIRRVYLSILYSCQSDTATFWWHVPGQMVWNKLPLDMDLNSEWGLPGNTVTLKAYLFAESYNYWPTIGSNLYFDNFKLVHQMPW
jgi:hypothetical protein